jgi:hypothetical protein
VCLGTRMQAHQRLAFVFEASSTSSCNSALTHQDAGASAPCVRERSWPATPGCSAWVSTAVSLNTDQPPPSSRVAASDKIRPTRTTQEPGLMSADCTAARHPLTAPARQTAPAAAAPPPVHDPRPPGCSFLTWAKAPATTTPKTPIRSCSAQIRS